MAYDDKTIREHIDAQILWHEQEIERLKRVRDQLLKILDVKVADVREAMRQPI